MMGQKILGKNLDLEIGFFDGTDTQTANVEGITSFTLNRDYTDTDTTDNDSDGNQESLPTSIGRSIDIEGNRLEDSNGDLTTGQKYLDSFSTGVGYDAECEFTLSTQAGDGVSKNFKAWPALEEPIGGGSEDHIAWSGTLNINGSVTTSTT